MAKLPARGTATPGTATPSRLFLDLHVNADEFPIALLFHVFELEIHFAGLRRIISFDHEHAVVADGRSGFENRFQFFNDGWDVNVLVEKALKGLFQLFCARLFLPDARDVFVEIGEIFLFTARPKERSELSVIDFTSSSSGTSAARTAMARPRERVIRDSLFIG